MLARVVGLLSQHVFERNGDWVGAIPLLDPTTMRPQWRRAWLLAPPGSPRFNEKQATFDAALAADGHALLLKFLTWFQAERTIPNPTILQSNEVTVSANVRMLAADLMGWPSDLPLWQRVLLWIFKQHANFPLEAMPTVATIFAVWQHMLAGFPNGCSERLLALAETWLVELETSGPNRWDNLKAGRDALATALRDLILKSADGYPETAVRVVDRIIAWDRHHGGKLAAVIACSPTLARACPAKLAELVRSDLIKELPKDKIERERQERQAQIEAIQAIRAKPGAERTEGEKRMLQFSHTFVSSGYSDRYNSDYSLDARNSAFYPAAAGTEPFASLFRNAPDVARRLVRDLANHASASWRQEAELRPDRHGTPIPLEIAFPWGVQRFWGDERTYLWFCGEWAPQPLETAWLSLSYWAHQQLDSGRDIDEVIREIVEGHDNWAALGLAVALTLERQAVTSVTVALATSQLLWRMDIRRQVQEASRGVNLLGLDPREQMQQQQREATDYLRNRRYRAYTLKDLSILFALSGDDAIRIRFRDALAGFPTNLPFVVEEQRDVEEYVTDVLETAKLWAGLGDAKNYGAQQVDNEPSKVRLEYSEPEPPSEELVRKRMDGELSMREFRQLGWVKVLLETGVIEPPYSLAEAIEFAQSRDSATLFDTVHKAGTGATQSCVADTANVALEFSDDPKAVEWAWGVMERITKIVDPHRPFRDSPNNFDPRISLIIGRCRDLRKPEPHPDSAARLVTLAGCDSPYVASQALRALLIQSAQPDLAWTAAVMATELFHLHIPVQKADGSHDNSKQLRYREEVTERALARLGKAAFTPLVLPPPPWVKEAPETSNQRRRAADGAMWSYPNCAFDARFAADRLKDFPIDDWVSVPERRQSFLKLLDALANWTTDRLYPEWADPQDDGHRSADLFEWIGALSRAVAWVAAQLPAEELFRRYVDRLARHDRREGLRYLAGVVDYVTRRLVYDAPEVPAETYAFVNLCMERLLLERRFNPTSYGAGEIVDQSVADIVSSLLLVSATDAPMASRFANGDWTDLPKFLPIIERLMLRAGWGDGVMRCFLRLCRSAEGAMPVDLFVRLVTASMDAPGFRQERWNSEGIPAEVSGAIQRLADKNYPLTRPQAQGLLTILDRLVDMGDRRAAALQQSEHFRSVQLPADAAK